MTVKYGEVLVKTRMQEEIKEKELEWPREAIVVEVKDTLAG